MLVNYNVVCICLSTVEISSSVKKENLASLSTNLTADNTAVAFDLQFEPLSLNKVKCLYDKLLHS